MAGPVDSAGASHDPTRYAALTPSAEQFAGLRTQRSPYSDGISSYLMRRFYSGIHFDQMLDGINREITVNLTDKRRPGSSVWNSVTIGPVLSFYSFKFIQNGVEIVRVIADTATAVYDVTVSGVKTLIYTKSSSAPMRFISVGTTLYMSDGADQVKWIQSSLIWTASTSFSQGNFIVDPNGNLQLNIGSQTATDINIAITSNVCTIYFSPNTALDIPIGTKLTFAGQTTVAALAGTTQTVTVVENPNEVSFSFTHANVPFSVETGTVTTGTGITGSSAPTWATGMAAVTQDGTAQWENRGLAVQQWMFGPPTTAPAVSQIAAPTTYSSWIANEWFSPLLTIVDSNGNAQQLTTAGITGSAHPTWATVKGTTTTDNTAVWTCLGSATRANSTAYTVGMVIAQSYTGYYSLPFPPYGGSYTYTLGFQCTVAGTSGAYPPSWANALGFGQTLTDGGVTWENIGSPPAWPGAAQTLTLITEIVDSNGNLQIAQQTGESGASAPTWSTVTGALTADNTQIWKNAGLSSGAANTGAWIYAYSGLNSITEDITTASQVSVSITQAKNSQISVQGAGMATVYDSIIIWRTAQGYTAPLIYDSTIPNPGPGNLWTYIDTIADTSTNGQPALNAFISAPVASSNNPPPAGLTGMTYHLQRLWGFVDNLVYYSGGPDTLVGNGNTAWPPSNFISYTGKVIKLRPITVQNGGILVYTTSGIWIILGTGTSSNPFYTTIYAEKIILGGYNVEDVLGTEINLMESNGIVSALTVKYPFDPQSGYNEVGLPIVDQFLKVTTGGISAALYTPATSYLSWNKANTRDTGMYVADGAAGWFRMGAVSPPESGLVWSPRAAIAGGTSAVQNVEVSPGVFRLLIGPPTGGGPILMRDVAQTTWTDNGTAYPAWDAKGVIPLCSTGSVSEVAWVASKSAAVGSRPVVSVLMGEIAVTANTPWTVLQPTAPDPADQPASQTVYSDRYTGQQGAAAMKSDSILLKFDYGSQAAADELLEFAIYGAKEEERKQQ